MGEIGTLLQPQLPKLRRYARSLTRNESDAEDLVQRCLVRALSKQQLWREGTDLRAWLFTILHNEFVNDLRRRARERDWLSSTNMNPAITNINPAALPRSNPEASYRVREVQQALSKLPDRQREIVLQVGLEGEIYSSVATALGLPIGTVRSRLSRARAALRSMTGQEPPLRKTRHGQDQAVA